MMVLIIGPLSCQTYSKYVLKLPLKINSYSDPMPLFLLLLSKDHHINFGPYHRFPTDQQGR